jgi:hypothetical protein
MELMESRNFWAFKVFQHSNTPVLHEFLSRQNLLSLTMPGGCGSARQTNYEKEKMKR